MEDNREASLERPAGFWRRAAALIIDAALVLPVGYLLETAVSKAWQATFPDDYVWQNERMGWALIFSALFITHISLLRLPYFWDEAGYFVPAARALMDRGETGIWNAVNEGIERHDEVLALWRDLAEPGRRIEVVAPEALAAPLKAPRSNCVLSTAKLRRAGLALPPLSESLPRLVVRYARERRGSEVRNPS